MKISKARLEALIMEELQNTMNIQEVEPAVPATTEQPVATDNNNDAPEPSQEEQLLPDVEKMLKLMAPRVTAIDQPKEIYQLLGKILSALNAPPMILKKVLAAEIERQSQSGQ